MSNTSFPSVSLPGLTSVEVSQRVRAGEVNVSEKTTSRSFSEIIKANVFTLFNAIIVTAMVAVLLTGSWKDAVFGGVVIVNMLIGIYTETRAKLALDNLSILVAQRSWVRRDGVDVEVDSQQIVLGDLLWVRAGEQVPADGVIVQSWNIEMDESMLTGESATVRHQVGEKLLSGSVCTSGMALLEVTAVGKDSYAAGLTAQAKKFKAVRSDLQDGINKILKWLTVVVIPLCLLLIWSQVRVQASAGGWRSATVSAVAGVVGMIPEGLVLLTSLNFALSSLRLARQKVLIQQMESVETLARVDSLNLDKTGTITDGGIEFDSLVPLASDGSALSTPASEQLKSTVLALFTSAASNATSQAISEGLGSQGVTTAAFLEINRIPFSSARKWSAVLVEPSDAASQAVAYFAGAPEMLLANEPCAPTVLAQVQKDASQGKRVLFIARASMSAAQFEQCEDGGVAPRNLEPIALVILGETVRSDAKQTLAYFRQQGVRCRIVSGDNPQTVAAIAQRVDLRGDGQMPRWMDARELPDDAVKVASILEDVDVLGRVLPEQKKLIVQALQLSGHTVAMTGDGVNDALAIKEADFGIAMGNATPATKAVADAVIIDSRFSHLPSVVGQGRRVMANMERVASLFLVKTCYSAIVALGVCLLGLPYPYLPRHMTYISALTIGIPAFILSLPANNKRYRPGFLPRVVAFSLPTGFAIGVCVNLATWAMPRLFGWSVLTDMHQLAVLRSLCAILVFVLGFVTLARVSTPLKSWRGLLVLGLFSVGVIGALIPQVAHFFAIMLPQDVLWRYLIGCLVAALIIFLAFDDVARRIIDRLSKKMNQLS